MEDERSRGFRVDQLDHLLQQHPLPPPHHRRGLFRAQELHAGRQLRLVHAHFRRNRRSLLNQNQMSWISPLLGQTDSLISVYPVKSCRAREGLCRRQCTRLGLKYGFYRTDFY